jgi:short-subunit dehydrogenase involved in D-alanine esterification of teichoic acids
VVFADMNEGWAKASSEESVKYASNEDYQTSVFVMNVQDAKSVEDMVSFVAENYGRLDYCVNAAGVSSRCLLDSMQITIAGTLSQSRRRSTTKYDALHTGSAFRLLNV